MPSGKALRTAYTEHLSNRSELLRRARRYNPIERVALIEVLIENSVPMTLKNPTGLTRKGEADLKC